MAIEWSCGWKWNLLRLQPAHSFSRSPAFLRTATSTKWYQFRSKSDMMDGFLLWSLRSSFGGWVFSELHRLVQGRVLETFGPSLSRMVRSSGYSLGWKRWKRTALDFPEEIWHGRFFFPHSQLESISHRIHGAGIYANIKGVYWWDLCYHIWHHGPPDSPNITAARHLHLRPLVPPRSMHLALSGSLTFEVGENQRVEPPISFPLPSDNLLHSYWKWLMNNWFTYSKRWFSSSLSEGNSF